MARLLNPKVNRIENGGKIISCQKKSFFDKKKLLREKKRTIDFLDNTGVKSMSLVPAVA